MKISDEELKELGFHFGRDSRWYKNYSNSDAYFYYDDRNGVFMDLRCSDGGDWSMVYRNIPSIEKMKEIEKVLDLE